MSGKSSIENPCPSGDYVLPMAESGHSANTASNVLSPTKRVQLAQGPPHESPDMRFARDRFGTLLTSIRNGEASPHYPGYREDGRRGPGRPRKGLPHGPVKKVIFELRGKPFALREDVEDDENMYPMCRAWMRGREDIDTTPIEPPENEEPPEDSLDLLATRDVYFLPSPQEPPVDIPFPNAFVPRNDRAVRINAGRRRALMDFIPHWRSVKKRWGQYTRERHSRFNRSIRLIETIYSIAQQNQHY